MAARRPRALARHLRRDLVRRLERVLAELPVQLARAHATLELRRHHHPVHVLVRLVEHVGREEHVVDADDPLLAELHVVRARGHVRRAAIERQPEVEVEIVIEVGAGRRDVVHEAVAEERHQHRRQPGGRERAGERQPHGRALVDRAHEELAGLAQAGGIVGVVVSVDELGHGLVVRAVATFEGRRLQAASFV